jgi:hypothetical protein
VIVTEHVNPPVELTVAPQLVIVAPEPIEAVTVVPGVNPLPEMWTSTPLGPWPGPTEIVGAVTVKVAVALSKLPSEPVAVTV